MTEFHNEVKDLMRFAGHGLQKCTVWPSLQVLLFEDIVYFECDDTRP